MFANCFQNRRVLVTGHTGFKGSWLCSWLLDLGATIAGYSAEIPTHPSHFESLGLANRMLHHIGDVRDRPALANLLNTFKPEIVFHLAAQPLVRYAYSEPLLTFETNAMGTLNLLECIRHQPSVQAAVFITSDKSYRNMEWSWGYRENDFLGDKDPYSASKACAENIIYSYFHSFFSNGGPRIGSTRAGNVIGGGDWAASRIVPDCVRAWSQGKTVQLRFPHATRPWQHVLEPLSGYLWLASQLWNRNDTVNGEAYNFGPPATVNQTVSQLIDAIAVFWPQAVWAVEAQGNTEKKEANLLKLNCDKALHQLQWQPVLEFTESVRFTAEWYRNFYAQAGTPDMWSMTQEQIKAYIKRAVQDNLAWTKS